MSPIAGDRLTRSTKLAVQKVFPVWEGTRHSHVKQQWRAMDIRYAAGATSLEKLHAVPTSTGRSQSVFNLHSFQLRLQRELEECYYAVTRGQHAINDMESPAEYGHQVCR